MTFNYSFGNYLYFNPGWVIHGDGRFTPRSTTTYAFNNRWTTTGQAAEFPRHRWGGNQSSNQRPNSRYLYEGDYVRLKSLNLSYNLPTDLFGNIGINSFKVYLDMNEDYVTSIMENENFNISTLTTNYGKPSVIHVPFMNRRLDFYNKIKDRIINYETLYNLFDIVIPVGPNDEYIIEKQIKFTKKNIIGYRNIYLICYKPSINISGCITIDENIFPFCCI